MIYVLYVLAALIVVPAGFYLFARLLGPDLLRLIDRSDANDRSSLPKRYELPRYFVRDSSGKLDTSARWPGWDGWYFFVLPDDRSIPTKMVRGSLMTGLYGLHGIDDYEEVLLRLSTFDAAEHLCLVPTRETVAGRVERENHLAQHYQPRDTDLSMATDRLDVSITGPRVRGDEQRQRWGRIHGRWPNYRMQFLNPEAEISLDLACTAENIIWWTDFPGIFTYFAAFGRFEGSITYHRGTHLHDPHDLHEGGERYEITGRGCFEHGFARKPFNFDAAWTPIRLLTQPYALNLARYHYELFIGEDGMEGGFMQAGGLGIKLRDRGGIYLGGDYHQIKSTEITYLDAPPPEPADHHCLGRAQIELPRRWSVRAKTPAGELQYTATRPWPPALIAPHMMYYYFDYEGTFRGQPIAGRGYGEYVNFTR